MFVRILEKQWLLQQVYTKKPGIIDFQHLTLILMSNSYRQDCDLEDCAETNKVGIILACGHAYHYECFLFKLTSRCKYCIDYLVSGIEKNCKAFQKSVNSFNGVYEGK